MKERLRRLWRAFVRIITLPIWLPIFLIRLPFRAFRRIRDFIYQEPEDAPLPDVLGRTLEEPSLLIDHLEALRWHLIRSLIALAVTTTLSFAFAQRILDFLARPIGGVDQLQAIEVTETIGVFMRVSLLSGLALALPYLLLEAFAFINPGLKPRERIIILMAVPVASLLFLAGMAFAYYIMLPPALTFLLNFLDIPAQPRPANYIRFATSLMFWVGVGFQFPLLIYAMAALGVVRARTLIEGWRIAVVAIAIFAAMVTPTVDPLNMALVMAPMLVLYVLSIGLALIAQRGRERAERRAGAAATQSTSGGQT
jgi:sec-independent protein translocase protein TatC